ncbi:MAG TPA: RDD family protein [Tepidisphaeraceae bacterium]|nr:RDD family protein [Tepidisphaeraceae bacterium]
MADPTWRYRVGNEERGPVTAEEICTLLAQGAIALQTPVWCAAVAKWVPAEIVPGFRQAASHAANVAVPALPPIEAPEEDPADAEITVPLEAVTGPTPEEQPAAQTEPMAKTEMPAPVEPQPVASIVAPPESPAPAAGEAPRSPASVPFVDASAYLPHPWVRFWARSIDWCFSLIGLVIVAAVVFIATGARGSLPTRTALEICGGWWIGCLLVEALMLAIFGATPGKALLGTRVEGRSGRPPSFGQALSRSIQVWIFGEALGIPILSWMTRVIWLALLSSSGQTIWDRNTLCRVRHQPCHFVRVASVAVMFCFIPALLFAAVIYMSMSHRPQLANPTVALKNLWQSTAQPAIKAFKSPVFPPAVAAAPHTTPKAGQTSPIVPVKTSPSDDRLRLLAGTWVIIVNQATSKGTLHWKNSLILQEDGTFRQKIRAGRHGVEQSEFSQDWAGKWTIKNNQLIQNVTVSTSPQHPAGTYVFNLSSDATSVMLKLQSQPDGAAPAGLHPSYRFHKAMAVADTTE